MISARSSRRARSVRHLDGSCTSSNWKMKKMTIITLEVTCQICSENTTISALYLKSVQLCIHIWGTLQASWHTQWKFYAWSQKIHLKFLLKLENLITQFVKSWQHSLLFTAIFFTRCMLLSNLNIAGYIPSAS